ncbi:hypothetical protein RFI_21874 [Reticulomyxa filosa]|uniref:Uncharacterized protein n=1 Tax=Reticulomyxa filosa TaxID=46433 RepID=X6MQX2_RETFI|nr:hypothetical protein RFI_21874 [Reticulomyxa filosa]|eukprot:ETO15490.1 hypothetical protein RFI_21874 [Reticulomyxa filosa]
MQQTIFFSEAGLKIVTNPFLVGDELLELATQSSVDFLKQLHSDTKQLSTVKHPVCLLNILRGGRYYGLESAWKRLYDTKEPKLHLAEIRAGRYLNAGTKEWNCNVWFDEEISSMSPFYSKQNLLKCQTLIIGDTIATGSTLKAFSCVSFFQKKKKKGKIKKKVREPLTVYIFSIAGSSIVAKNLRSLVKELQTNDKINVHLYLANAAWELNEENGTDLSLVTSRDNIHPKAFEYIDKICGKNFAKHMKCAVWDWGQRFDGIDEHLKEVVEYFHTFHPADLPPHIRKHNLHTLHVYLVLAIKTDYTMTVFEYFNCISVKKQNLFSNRLMKK